MKDSIENQVFIENSTFALDVKAGLTHHPKYLLSRYFYDKQGDKLFQQIMALPEYYLTRCEFEILQHHKGDILKQMQADRFNLVELGVGDGLKTKVLLRHFLQQKVDFRYMPIDISGTVLHHLEDDLKMAWPDLPIDPVEGEYFSALEKIDQTNQDKKLVLFLGSNIGNMNTERSVQFLRQLREKLRPGDALLIGFDLKKDPATILEAYNDSQGVTAAFNLNLLTRINRELDANFDVAKFVHWPTYNPVTGNTKSYLLSLQNQEVSIRSLNLRVSFKKWEPIDMELSKKYDVDEIIWLANQTGFEMVKGFFDSNNYFTDAFLKAV